MFCLLSFLGVLICAFLIDRQFSSSLTLLNLHYYVPTVNIQLRGCVRVFLFMAYRPLYFCVYDIESLFIILFMAYEDLICGIQNFQKPTTHKSV